MLAEYSTRYLGQSVDYLRYLGSEHVFDVLDGVVGIFDHIV